MVILHWMKNVHGYFKYITNVMTNSTINLVAGNFILLLLVVVHSSIVILHWMKNIHGYFKYITNVVTNSTINLYVHILNKPHPLVAEHFIMCLLVLLVVLYTCIIIYIVEIIYK